MLNNGKLYATAGKIGPLNITDSQLSYSKTDSAGFDSTVFSINPAATYVGAYSGDTAISAQSARFDVQKFGWKRVGAQLGEY